jgi:ketosteroid isomerase-like protein
MKSKPTCELRSPFLRMFGTVLALAICVATGVAQSGSENGAATGQAASGGQAEATAEIKDLIAKYAEAVNREPVDMELAAQVWSQSPDVSFIFPLGEEHGWEEVKQKFYQDIMEARFSERTLSPRDIQVHVYGDSAWAEFSWRFVAKSRKDNARVETNGRETQIYRKIGPHRWALVHVHYSAMPPAER